MKVKSTTVSILLLLLIACDPAKPEQNKNDIGALNEVNEVNAINDINEAELEKDQRVELAVSEKSLQVLVDDNRRDNETALLDEAKNLQNQTETELLKRQVAEQQLAEQALLESARNNADQLDDSLN